MVQHFNNTVANNLASFKEQHAMWWDHTTEMLTTHGVDIMMADANMAACKMVTELRSRGLIINVAAWWPWKDEQGRPKMDSVFIAFLNKPGVYKLYKGMGDLHQKRPQGILFSIRKPLKLRSSGTAMEWKLSLIHI